MKAIASQNRSTLYDQTIDGEFRDFIIENQHPCIMANTVFAMNDYEIHIHEKLGSKITAKHLLRELGNYIDNYDFSDNKFESFIAVFPDTQINSEIEFENLIWRQLQFIHDIDGNEWDHRVSSDPADSNFSFSIGGRAFYIVGMHPNSSRMARQSPYPSIVFNLHSQFEKLREMDVYHKVRDKIRSRDEELQGTINPVLKDFGESSEARQYSGRNVGSTWKCPFHSQK